MELAKIKKIRNSKIFLYAAIAAFLVTQACFFVLIQVFNKQPPMRALQFSSVANCFLFALLFLKNQRQRIFGILALAFTLISDFILVIINNADYHILMFITFSTAHLFYMARLLFMTQNRKLRRFMLIFRFALIIAMEIAGIFILEGMGKKHDMMSVVAVFYFINLVTNVIFGFVFVKKNAMFAIGMFLFLLCDICVWALNPSGYVSFESVPLLSQIASAPINYTWIFYVPSQTLLALSVLKASEPLRRPVFFSASHKIEIKTGCVLKSDASTVMNIIKSHIAPQGEITEQPNFKCSFIVDNPGVSGLGNIELIEQNGVTELVITEKLSIKNPVVKTIEAVFGTRKKKQKELLIGIKQKAENNDQ